MVRVSSNVVAEGVQDGRVPLDAGVARLPAVDPHVDQGLENQLTAQPPGIGFGYNGADLVSRRWGT